MITSRLPMPKDLYQIFLRDHHARFQADGCGEQAINLIFKASFIIAAPLRHRHPRGGQWSLHWGYHACPRIHVNRVVFEDRARYVRNVFRVSKHAKSRNRVYFSYRDFTCLGSLFRSRDNSFNQQKMPEHVIGKNNSRKNISLNQVPIGSRCRHPPPSGRPNDIRGSHYLDIPHYYRVLV